MKVILLKDVPKVGHKFEVKEVADGFGRNVIIAKGAGLLATPENLAKVGTEIKRVAETGKLRQELMEKGMGELDGLEITLSGKTNKEGHLFAAIHKENILAAIKEQKGLDIDPAWIILDKPLKTAGEHSVILKAGNKTATFKVTIKNIK